MSNRNIQWEEHMVAGRVDRYNSTDTPLAADAVFTGKWVNTESYSEFSVMYTTDVTGTINMDLSSDAVNVDRSKQVIEVSGGVHTLAVVSKFMRVRWTNNGTDQTHFRLQSMLHKYKSKDLTSTMIQQVSDANDVTLVRDASIAEWDIARELYTDKTAEYIVGANDSVSTTWTDIFPSGTHNYPWQTSASILEILSDDANDSGRTTAVLTLAGQPSDGDTFTIGSRTYTFQTTLTNVDGNIHISSSPATAAGTVLNIVDAITLGSSGEGSGTGYAAAMTVNTSVTASDGTGDTVDFESLTTYPLANDGDTEVLATTETGANLSFGASATVHPPGAHTVEIHGLSATGADQDEIVVLDGTTPVDTTLSYLRVNQFHLQTVGSQDGANYGNITVRVTGGGDTLSQIQGYESTGDKYYGHGEGNSGIHTIPLNRIAYLTGIEVSVDGNKKADVVLYEAEDCLRSASPYLPRRLLWQALGLTGDNKITLQSFVKIKPLTDLYFRAKTETGSAGVDVRLAWFQAIPNADNK